MSSTDSDCHSSRNQEPKSALLRSARSAIADVEHPISDEELVWRLGAWREVEGLVVRVAELEKERDDLRDWLDEAVSAGASEDVVAERDEARRVAQVWKRKREAASDRMLEAEARVDVLEAALEQIALNAEAWHGPPADAGHERALSVIAKWAHDPSLAWELSQRAAGGTLLGDTNESKP